MELNGHQNSIFFEWKSDLFIWKGCLWGSQWSHIHTGQVTDISTAPRKWFHTRDNHPPICLSAAGQSEGVGKGDPDNRAITGSICVVIYCTCAPRVSGWWRTDGGRGSRCCYLMTNQGGWFLISELFSVIAVMYDDTHWGNKITEQHCWMCRCVTSEQHSHTHCKLLAC